MITKVEDMTMENFPLDKENRREFIMCESMLSAPEECRLLFIALPADQRLHLKHGICNFWRDSVNWRSDTAGEFSVDLVAAIRAGRASQEMQKYQEPDVWILDDLQHLSGKLSTQESLYRVIKRRMENWKLTILFSEYDHNQLRDCMIDELANLMRMGLM